jgi:membrane-bound serine protease (ClpP class)
MKELFKHPLNAKTGSAFLYCLTLFLLSLTSFYPFPSANAQMQAPVHVLTLAGIINPPAANYIRRGINQAEEAGAAAIVLRLDTPGGLDDSMRDIVQSIGNSTVPVIVYITPSGGRAASAGTFITMSAHVAAMSPATTIGAATPITMGGAGAEELPEDLRGKVIADAASYIRALAELRGRNAEWAEQAVREGDSITAAEAVGINVVDLLADDLEDLLQQAHGRQVELVTGEVVTLDTADAPVARVDMTLVEEFLHVISNPNVAFILLSLAMLGIFFEFANPGTFIPGALGGILLLLALYSLGTLNAFWGGILLIVLAFGLFVAEIFTPTTGVLALGGVVSLVTGAMVLFADAPPGVRVDPWAIGIMAATTAAFFLFVVGAVVRSQRRNRALMGYGSLVEATGVARTGVSPQEEGTVLVQGEHWRAIATDEFIPPGAEVTVNRVEGMRLWVSQKK